MQATIGVFPLPPTRRLPTLTTGCASRWRQFGCVAYHWRRHAAADPYAELKTWINAPDGTGGPPCRARSATGRRSRRLSSFSLRDSPPPGLAPQPRAAHGGLDR